MSASKKILMIEDEDVFIEMFGNKLKQDGYEVVIARNGAWGVKEALADDFDLFIMDMVMPALNGEEMINRIKLEDKTKNVPIIVLSNSVDQETQKRVEDLGVQAFFVKTHTTPNELSMKIAEMLNIAESESQS